MSNTPDMNKGNRLAAIEAIKNKFISSVTKIYVNGIKREVGFREITVAEQKKLSRIMIDNENRKDIIYDAQCAVLKAICLDPEVDIYQLTEFDKIKLLMLLYQRNMMKHDITFTCPNCNNQNKYRIDFSEAIRKLDGFELEDIDYLYENDSWKFDFKLSYPTVKKVSDFYSARYLQIARNADKKVIESFNTNVNIDYINLFVKSVSFQDKTGGGQATDVNADDYSTAEFFDIISVFPQDVLYSENGIITYITDEFISKINNVFDHHKCMTCGYECENTLEQGVESFF